ncbi:MAG: SDR family NAD(P)-dependent oxidoreductase [Thermomicrobiales bacterium]
MEAAMGRLAERVAIVTGGAQGIGGATARKLAAEGAKVLIADIDEATMAQNAARIRAAGGTVETIVADVSQSEQNKRMIDAAVDHWGALHLLVNNAFAGGKELHGSAVEVPEEEWNRGLAILMTSIFLGVKHAVPVMERAGGGAIVNLSSVHGLLMAPRKLVYEAGKSAVIGMTRQMAIDFGPLGIRVNAICPGHIVTERITPQWEAHPDGLRYFARQYPVRRTGVPDDIANAIAFLCSDEASFITGQALAVDGGLTLQLQEDFAVDMAHYLRDQPDTWLPY